MGVRPALRDLLSAGQGLRLVHQLRPDLYPTYRFCSLRCLDAGAALAGSHNGMIDKTELEQQAIKDARRPFAAALTELGLMEHFFDLSAEQIDQLIEAAVDGFRESMQRQPRNEDVPWDLTEGRHPLEAKPSADAGRPELRLGLRLRRAERRVRCRRSDQHADRRSA